MIRSAFSRVSPLWKLLLTIFIPCSLGAGPAQPNILWITCEDMSPSLGCYGDPDARTPHLDKLAARSVRYTHAFATAPACSPARSALITGIYATSLNTQNLRSAFPVPNEFKGFPTYLRATGYYCSNNHKTDYNIADERAMIAASWNESSPKAHWRKRKSGQPFFSVFNLMETHQSRTSAQSFQEFEKIIGARLAPAERHDPAKVQVPPYYPDTPTVRRTLARYHDCVTAMDKEVGRILKELEEDGLVESTIVFFFSDHGAGLPRGKRTLYDSGTRVPLLVHFPKTYQHLAPTNPGKTVKRLISFVDFAPTVLNLANASIPKHMEGRIFAGKTPAAPREFVFCARDRVDEAFDLSRSVRDARYLYIRNYMPHLSWNQPEGFSDGSDMRREITRLAADGKLNAAQLTYAGPTRPVEELYDTQSDPHQIHNLADSRTHRDALEELRAQSRRWIIETRDVGFVPEQAVWNRLEDDTPWEMARDSKRFPQEKIIAAAELVGRREAIREQRAALTDSDAAVRYWGAVGLRALGQKAKPAQSSLVKALKDSSASVRIEAAVALVQLGEIQPALAVLEKELQSKQGDSAVHAARSLQLLGEKARPSLPAMKQALEQKGRTKDHQLYIRFSLQAALRELGTGNKEQ